MAAPRSAPPGRRGSWEAPGALLVCSEGREGKSPRCFEQEQNSWGTRMPFGVRPLQLGLGCGRCWSSALAAELGSQDGLWARSCPRGSRRWVCVTRGESREGRMEAGGGSRGFRVGSPQLRSTPTPSQLRCRFRFISGAPQVPPPDRYLSLNPSLLFLPPPLPPGSAPAVNPGSRTPSPSVTLPVPTVWLLVPVLLLALCLSYV